MRDKLQRDVIWYLTSIVVVLTIVAAIVPWAPAMPESGLDPSWRYGMNQAMAGGLAIGRDVIFTFGPYGSVYTRLYHPGTDRLMVAGSMYFSLSLCFALLYLMSRQRPWAAVLFAAVLAITGAYAPDVLFFIYPVLIAASIVARSDEATVKPLTHHLGLAILLFGPVGMLPLIKGSLFMACAAVTTLTTALWLYRRQPLVAVVTATTPLACMAIFWILSGQSIVVLPIYLRTMVFSISGYSEAMAINGPRSQVYMYIGAAALLVYLCAKARDISRDGHVYMLLMLAAILFLSFKAGFVRHDGHAVIAAFLLLLSSLVMAVFLKLRPRVVAVGAASAVAFITANHFTELNPVAMRNVLLGTYTSAWQGIITRVAGKGLLPLFNKAIADLSSRSTFPKLEGSTDIYSYNQAGLIASGNLWTPRPVFQSYAAYTATLLETNKRHLQGSAAPENIIFRVEPIDGRLPSMEDGASWPLMYSAYRPVMLKDHYLYLRRQEQPADVQPTLLSTSAHMFGSEVIMPQSEAPIVVEIHVKKSFIGKLVDFMYKTSPLKIQLTLENGDTRSYRVVSGMMQSGMLLSPLIENTVEFALLYGEEDRLLQKRVRSFKIVPRAPYQWDSEYQVSFKQLNFKKIGSLAGLFQYDNVQQVPPEVPIKEAAHCDGAIDSVNGILPAPRHLPSASTIDMKGWLAISTEKGLAPQQILIVLSDSAGKRTFIQARSVPRPDVARYFGQPELAASGYSAFIDASRLSGAYVVGLAYVEKEQIFLCPNFGITGNFGGPPLRVSGPDAPHH